MMRSALIWTGALGVSAGVHVASAFGLYLATQPGDVPEQPMPETEMQLAAYQVQRSEARETAPDSDQAASGDTGGAALTQGSIATSRASALRPGAEEGETVLPSATSVAAMPPTGTVAPALPETGAPLAPQAVLQGAPVTAIRPVDVALPPERPLRAPVPVATIAPERMSEAAPKAVSLASETMVQIALSTTDAAAAAMPAPPVQPQATRPDAPALASQAAFRQPVPSLTAPEQAPQPRPAAQQEPQASPAARQEPQAGLAAEQDPQTSSASRQDPQSSPAPQQAVRAETAASVAPPADRAKAALAFQNSAGGAIDPVSLTAFQSFMEPGDLSGAAAEIRDGIKGALSAIPCSRLQVQFVPDENSLLVSGHVPDPDLRDTVVSAMQAQMGRDIPVRSDLLILPSPQCAALSGIANVGLPQSTDQITNPLLVGEDTHAREFRYTAGKPLVMTLQGADYDAYVYVDYFDADGNVLHLAPNEYTPLERTEAKSELQIGSDHVLDAGEPGLYIEIGPPFGQEIAVAFAASRPLYDGVRPLVEPAEPYLDWLRDRVAEARAADPDFKGEWVYFFISTSED